MPENDFIYLTDRQFAQFRTLATLSALALCATVTPTPHGGVIIEKLYGRVSSGEEVLWDTLAALAVGNRPSEDFFHRLDTENRAIAEDAIASIFGSAA